MNDEQFFLANAYLDGELTDDERRIAEADPDVMSEVEQLRALQASVRDVTPPSDAARNAAITAAMAEFGRVAGPTSKPAPASAPVVPYRPRPAYARYLAVAAAVVAVFGLGIVVSQANIGGGDDDDAGAPVADEAAEQTFEELAEADIAGDADTAATDAAEDTAEEAAEEGADGGVTATAESAVDVGDEAADEMAAEPAADDASEEAAAEEPMTTVPAAARVAVPPSFDPDQPIREELELGVYGAYLLGLRDRGLLEPTPNTSCFGDYAILDTAPFRLDDVVTDEFVAVDEFNGIVYAIAASDCSVLLEASLI